MEKRIVEYIRGMPKIELHLHIEGSFEPKLVFEIAKRNNFQVKIEKQAPQNEVQKTANNKLADKATAIGLRPQQTAEGGIKVVFDTPKQLALAYDFDNLQEFLDIYYAGMNVLQSELDFYDLTMAYLRKCKNQNIVHVEIFFDPQGHTCRGVSFDTVINGIFRALQEGESKLGISSGLIMSYLRHLSEEDALSTWQEAKPHLDKLIGIGLDSAELGHPPEKFKNVFTLAREEELKLVAHAGEEGPPEYVWQALDLLQIDRVDHGNRSLEDSKLVDRLVATKKILTVCPLSNNKLQVVSDMKSHPIKRMLDLGLKATVNSDDPAYFGGYMNENYEAVQASLELSFEDIHVLAHNSIDGSFVSAMCKDEFRAALNKYHTEFNLA